MLLLIVGLLCVITTYVVGLVTTIVVTHAVAAIYFYTKRYNDNSENLCANRYWSWFHERFAILVTLLGKKLFSYEVVYHEKIGSSGNEVENMATSGSKGIVFCASPHGLYPLASLLHLSQPSYDRVRAGVHRNIFWFPVLRDLVLWCGGFSPSRDNIKHVLTKNSVYITIGGSREMLLSTSPDCVKQKRRGILEVAYDEGRALIPVIHQGQEDVFQCYTFEALEKVRLFFMDTWGYAFPTFFTMRLRPVTTHVYEPMSPGSYESCDAFVDAYYKRVEEYKAKLSAQRTK